MFTVTIDGADSKDFDDAISIDKGSDYILYTHIADDLLLWIKIGILKHIKRNSIYLLF